MEKKENKDVERMRDVTICPGIMKDVTILGSLKDVVDVEYLEIKISADGKDVWINNEVKCLFRARKIKQISINDMRKK